MGSTLAEKLLIHNTGEKNIKPGDIVIAYPDRYMIHDIYTSFLKRALKDMGVTKALHPEKAVIVLDHLMPTNQAATDPEHFRDGLELCEKLNIQNLHKGEGISHSLMHELRYAKPGDVVVATDSHTTTYGGAACFCTGIGHTEMAAALATGEIWLKVPSAIKIVIDGEFKNGVSAKDIILKILGDIKSDGGQYKSLEFTGSAVKSMSMNQRFTIANMSLEAGAKCGLFEVDEKTADYYGMDYSEISWLTMDEDAQYEKVLHYNVSELEPQLSCPQGVDNVHGISAVEGTKLNEVYIGSCTNGSIEDMAVAAEILKGKKIAKYLKLVIIPATNHVFKESMRLGYIKTFIDAGGMVSHPCCGLCCGQPYGLLSDGEVVLGTNNRNFIGRMGTKKSLIYLSSPAVAATSALTGVITNPVTHQA
ncbi:aconitase/3-isopropylmalate dehydratase large subunit family protein [Paenibacillus kribbensis]|uniref:3-isopropylmalate dehydratase large subunit n=1 Tax=Paenibacillus kribbensis TaxID=172713 RepID=UPI002DB6366F|nr:aconitase/3-isopropylmalate dehydratase large subunit family protein [Paenibacillus kribbensis]MEC0236816.1 aconitase/3-isopropylmalate dehydratase large subunit family protein [Paenibacillus kribbensis]